MLCNSLFWCLALLFLSNRVLALTLKHEDGLQNPLHNEPPSSSSKPTARLTPYVILMTRTATREQIQSINNTLSAHAAPGSLEGKASTYTGLVVFFRAAISSVEANVIEKLPGVAAVAPDLMSDGTESPPSPVLSSLTPRHESPRDLSGSSLSDVRNPAHVRLQPVAPPELKVISQPPGSGRAADLPGFAYASKAGKGVTIYFIESGANTENPEWKDMTGTKRTEYAPQADMGAGNGHERGRGSCISSKLTGPLFGTAKNANIVMVKLPKYRPVVSSILTSLTHVDVDVKDNNLKGKAVINMSLGGHFVESDISIVNMIKYSLKTIMREDVVVVVASGDSREQHDEVTNHPALFGRDTDIIVVGAVDNDGVRTHYSQGTVEELTTSAPGDVVCASGRTLGWVGRSGTSSAIPAVAGVIAVWLSQDELAAELQVPGKVAANVKARVKKFSYPRVEGGPPVIWNGIDPRGLDCKSSTGPGGAGSGCQTTASAQPPHPPQPVWIKDTRVYRKAYEQNGVVGSSYFKQFNSSEHRIESGFDLWCLGRCLSQEGCVSLFVYRELRFRGWEYDESYICNLYKSKWSKKFVEPAVITADAGVAYTKKTKWRKACQKWLGAICPK